MRFDLAINIMKITRALGRRVQVSPHVGIVEIEQALERGLVEDGLATRTVR